MHSDSKRDKALSAALQLAETFCKGATGCGVVGVESAAGLLLALIQQLKTVKENVDTCKGLIAELSSLATLLDSLLDEIGRPKTENERVTVARLGSEEEFKFRVDGLLAALRSVEEDARALVVVTSDKSVKASIKRFFTASPNKDRLNSMADALRKATKDFHFRGSIAVELLSRELLNRLALEVEEAKAARIAQERREEESRLAQERRDEEARLEKALLEAEQKNQRWINLLGRLERTCVRAEYSSMENRAGPPLRGTRVGLLQEIEEWAMHSSSEDNPPFYVLTGGAGTGKSTIAYGIADSAMGRRDGNHAGQLAASFFFTRGAAGLDSVTSVFPTMAHHMLTHLPALKHDATSVLEEYLRLGEQPKLEIQADYLFVRLLSQLPPDHPPIVIVIDAMDECADTNQAKRILKLMMDGLATISSAVRIFVTSRPEVHIEHALRSSPFVASLKSPDFVNRLQRFRLHEIPQDVVDSDIRLYLKTELRELQADSIFGQLSAADELTRLAAGLFIYATTMIQYLRSCAEDGSVPDLAPLVAGEHTAPKSALNKLGDLYAVILDRATLGASDPERSLAAMKIVLGYIAVLQDHLSPNALIALSPPDLRDHVFPALRRLAPVLSFVPEKEDLPVRPLHASFVDFLLNPSSSRAEHLVWAPEQHLRLATATLNLLNEAETVTHYISSLQDSPQLHSSDPNAQSIPSEFDPSAMQYACLYWPAHVTHYFDSNILLAVAQKASSTQASESDVQRLIQEYQAVASAFFVPAHIIRWIEVLGYLQRLDTVTDWLLTLCRSFSDLDKSLADMLYDAYRLVVVFYPALAKDPRQLYISALPQCPDTSLLRACIPEGRAVPRSLLPYPAWSPSVTHETEQLRRTVLLEPEYRWLVRPSPDRRWVAASLSSGPDRRGDIHLRDAATGIVTRTLHVLASGLVDFGISSDSRFIVSATLYGEICITDTTSGIPVASYNHTDGKVTRIMFRRGDSEVLLVHGYREPGGYPLPRPVRFLTLDWDRTERPDGELRPRWESHGMRQDTRGYGRSEPWSLSPTGRWGVLWSTGHLLDLHSFDEVKLSLIPDTTEVNDRDFWPAKTCGTWLSASSLVCSIPHKDGCSLIIIDIGQDIKEVEKQPRRFLSTHYRFSAMEASANSSLVALYGDSSSGKRIFLWDSNGDDIRFVKHIYKCAFCLSPLGDALYLAGDSTWSVIPTSASSTAVQPLHATALKFSAARDTVMVATQRLSDRISWQVGILSRGFSSSSGTAGVVSKHYFGRRQRPGVPSLTPAPQSMIFPGEDVVLHSSVGSSKIFRAPSCPSEHERFPHNWWNASMSPNLTRIVACGPTPDSNGQELIFGVWDTSSATLLYAFRTPRPSLPDWAKMSDDPHEEIIITDALDIHYLLDHHSFTYRHSDWSTSYFDKLQLVPPPELGPVPGEWLQVENDGWVTRSDGHPEVGRRGREKLFWIPPSQRVDQLWRGDQHLLAMTTEYDVIVLDLSDFDDDTKEQHARPLQIENE